MYLFLLVDGMLQWLRCLGARSSPFFLTEPNATVTEAATGFAKTTGACRNPQDTPGWIKTHTLSTTTSTQSPKTLRLQKI